VDNLGPITHYIDKLGLTNLKISAPTPYTQDLAIGVRKDWPLMASALDKALASLGNEEKAAIKARWLGIQVQPLNWWALVTWAAPVAAVLLAVIVTIVIWNRRLGREVQERKDAEERLRAMAANVPGTIFQMEVLADGRREYRYLSPGAREFFGAPPEVVINEKRLLPWHPDDQGRIQSEVAIARAAARNLNLVGRILLPDGQVKWLQVTASYSDEGGGRRTATGFILDITPRKLAEMEYLASERKIKAMSQAVDDALVMLDSQGKVRFWNPAAERLFGYTAQEAQGGDFHQMAAPPAYREQARQGLEGFARDGQGNVLGVTTEIEAQDRQGRVFPVEVTLSSFQVDQEWFAVGTVRDISARKLAEQAIKDSEQRLAGIIDFLPDPALVIDSQGKVVSWNRSMERLTGVAQEAIIGRGDYEYALPFYGQRRPILVDLVSRWDQEVAQQYLSIRQEGECLIAESFHPHMGEGGLFLLATATALYDGAGQVAGAIVTLRDITERKRAESLMVEKEVAEEAAARAERARQEAETARAEIEQYKGRLELLVQERTEKLRNSEELSRMLLQSAGEGIFGVDDQGLVTFINPAALAMLGLAEPDILGKEAHALVHHSHQDGTAYPEENCPMHDSFVNGTTHHVNDEVLWRQDGQCFSVEYSSTPISKGGQVVGAVVTFRDVSERKQVEEAMRQYMEDLKRFNRLTLGREVRMIELKEEVNGLLGQMGRGKKYKTSDEADIQ
jgi:PAS domain S-box-containing protein